MRIAVHYHSAEGEARETVKLVREAGSAAELLSGDLRVAGQPERVVGEAARVLKGLDVLINSAAIMRRTPVGEVTVQDWDDIFALNLRAPFFACQAAAEIMRERGGCIVNIADLAAFETWTGYIPHGISKAGVVQMTRALANALAPKIRVNAVAPGAVLLPKDWDATSAEHLSETTPLRRLGSPDDVTHAVIYLLRADYVTGETLVVDGGRHVRR
jgi:pteridine reductase